MVNYIKNKPIIDYKVKNANAYRYLPIPDKLVDILLEYKNSNGYISKNTDREILREHQLDKLWTTYQEDLGLTNITQYMIRHIYATMLYISGIDINLLGHNDIKTLLQIYTHLEDNMKSKFNSYVNKL